MRWPYNPLQKRMCSGSPLTFLQLTWGIVKTACWLVECSRCSACVYTWKSCFAKLICLYIFSKAALEILGIAFPAWIMGCPAPQLQVVGEKLLVAYYAPDLGFPALCCQGHTLHGPAWVSFFQRVPIFIDLWVPFPRAVKDHDSSFRRSLPFPRPEL